MGPGRPLEGLSHTRGPPAGPGCAPGRVSSRELDADSSSVRPAARARLVWADDDKRLLAAIGRNLKRHSARVDFRLADNGVDALVQVGAFAPDLVVLDLNMPGLNGLEVCRRLKAGRDTREIGIVFVSGEACPALAEEALSRGARRFFSKPVRVEVVLDELEVGPRAVA